MKNIENWLYEFWHGHPFLLNEEVDIILKQRADERYKWMTEKQIQNLIKFRIKEMYKKKYQNN